MPHIRWTASILTLAAFLLSSDAQAQSPSTVDPRAGFSATAFGPDSLSRAVAAASDDAWLAQAPGDHRPCPGCPPRRLGTAFIQATVINVFYELGNLARGEETAKLSAKTWWTNMRRGWEWDA